MFLEEISLKYLFIGFAAEGKQAFLEKELDRPYFVSWNELVIEDGEVFAKNIPISKFKFIMAGAIHDNTDMYSCVIKYINKYKIGFLSYGTPHELENKLVQSVIMKMEGVSQIKTIIGHAGKVSCSELIKALNLPIVSKIVNGSQGKGIVKHDTKDSLSAFLNKNKDESFIFQEFIPNDGDFRTFYLKDKLIYSIKRITASKSEFRNNVSLGGSQEFIDLSKEAESLANKACKAMGFGITGVDLIQHSKTGKWYVMEINAAPQFVGPEFKQVMAELVSLIKTTK